MAFEKNSMVHDYQLKSKKLAFEVAITAHATPASKVHDSDLPGVAILRSEGKVADADAVETVSFTTAVDATNCVFGIILKASELGSLKKVKQIKVTELTSTGSAVAVTKHGTRGLTTAGNIAFSVTSTGTSLDSESPRFFVEIDYQLAE